MTKPSIIIVDDNPDNLQVLGKTLKNEDYQIEFATNGRSALEWIIHQDFDLVLLDVMMPEMDGFEVCRRIRSDSRFDDLPIIFLTAQTDTENVLRGFESGAQDYVTKPFDTPELLARVRTHLELRNIRTRLEEMNKELEKKVEERTLQLHGKNRELELANRELAKLDHAKTDFLNLISHEIRTPLNGILGPAQLIKERIGTGELYPLFEVLDLSVSRLEKFSLTALSITRLNADRDNILKISQELGSIINEALDILSEKMIQKKLSADLKEDPPGLVVAGEKDLLRTCLLNVLDNAVRFSPREGAVVIKAFRQGTDTVCEVADQGEGFVPEMLENPYKLFSSSEPNIDGNIGISLYLSKLIMEAHKGSIEVENRPEGGALVRMRFKDTSEGLVPGQNEK